MLVAASFNFPSCPRHAASVVRLNFCMISSSYGRFPYDLELLANGR